MIKPLLTGAILFATSAALAQKEVAAPKPAEPGQANLAASPSDKPAKDKSDKSSKDESKQKLTGEQRWLQAIQSQLQTSEAEWDVLVPRLQKVLKLQAEANAGHDPKGLRPPKSSKSQSSSNGLLVGGVPANEQNIKERSGALTVTLLDPNAPISDIRVKLAAVREARAKAKRDLAAAQDELRQLLTFRQEGVLIIMGVLD